MSEVSHEQSTRSTEKWNTCCCGKAPKDEVIFVCQVLTALIVIVCGLLNITLTTENTSLWATLVSGAVGYLLPGPRLNGRSLKNSSDKENESLLHDVAVELVDERVQEQHSSKVHDDSA